MKNKKIAIIGCGNLGLSILNGLLANSSINPGNIFAPSQSIFSTAFLTGGGLPLPTHTILSPKVMTLVAAGTHGSADGINALWNN